MGFAFGEPWFSPSFASKGAFLCFLRSIMSSSFEVAVFCLIFDKVLYSFFCLFLQSYEEYVEIHSRCMRQLGLPVRSSLAASYSRNLVSFCAGDSTITCLQVKQMMGPGNHLGQQTHGFWAKSGLCSNTLNNCFNQELDGSSNIIAAVSTGSIIGVYSPYESNDISTVNELLSLSLSTWPLRKDTQCLCCTVGFTGAAKSRNGMHKPLDFYCKPFSDYMVPLKFPIDA
ncbi:hypothetical protein HID58_056658 [Brassica napus]|uniref:Uncharacterized protein n=1 Tax=Brassica napus TaxID=3708 RepID=A0ABQ8ANT4_BRANA|nr:hypothetical protein HID58_056658 [Brassica napus]